jgi:hypothetical protein
VGKQEVKVCTDKVNLTSVAKNLFFCDIVQQVGVRRIRKHLNFVHGRAQ